MSVSSFLNGRIVVVTGDITRESCDAIVNAANSTLLGGGGVDGAIHAAGGPEILEQCRVIRREQHPEGLPTGQAVITTAGRMSARYVIHTVGPIYGTNDGRDEELLASCYSNCLRLAARHGILSIAFPAISTGIYGFPKHKAAEIASSTIEEFLLGDDLRIQVRLVFHSEVDTNIFLAGHRFGQV